MRNLERDALLGCGGVLVRDFFRPARVVGGGNGTKFSLLAQNGSKSAFWGVPGEFCTGLAAEPGSLGEFCTGWACQGRSLGEFCTGWVAEPGGRESFVPGGSPSRAAGRVLYRVGLPRPLAGRVLYRKRPRMRDKVLPARVVGGGSGKKFSLHAKGGPKSAFWGLLGEFCTGWACQGRLLGEFCTGWAAEPGSRASFVSLKARCGLHRAFLAPIAPPIDAAVMRCRYAWARWPCPTGQREPHPGSVGYAFVAPRKPPAHASCAGGRQRKHQQATQAVQTT